MAGCNKTRNSRRLSLGRRFSGQPFRQQEIADSVPSNYRRLVAAWVFAAGMFCGVAQGAPAHGLHQLKPSPNYDCPAGDRGFEAGCVFVREEPGNPGSRNISLFYEWYKKFDPTKEVIIFLNGGPGGHLGYYNRLSFVRPLGERYNILFFDQRGTGRSSPLTTNHINEVNLDNYHTDHIIDDIESLRQRVVKRNQVIVMGHSYGGKLALGYATRYPQFVKKVVALNGAADNHGIVLQPTGRKGALATALRGISEARIMTLFHLFESGQAVTSDGTPFTQNDFVEFINNAISSYAGQMSGIRNLVDDLFESSVIRRRQLPEKSATASATASAQSDSDKGLRFNEIANAFIVCNDLLPMTTLNAWQDGEAKTDALEARQVVCAPSTTRGKEHPFDVKEDLGRIQAPVFLAGGTHDPLVPLKIQERDYALLVKKNVRATFLRMNNVGHNFFSEDPECAVASLELFLNDGLASREYTCPQILAVSPRFDGTRKTIEKISRGPSLRQ